MRRFNYEDNDEFREDVDKFFNEGNDPGITEEDIKAMMEEEEFMQDIQIKLVYRDLNHRILRTAIRTCTKSFWWWFCSHNTRLKMIQKTYESFREWEEE